MRHKHNKKRNTAFLFEVLIREMTKSVINEDAKKKKYIVSLLKEFFSKDSVLYKELQLYKNIVASKNLKSDIVVRIISEARRVYSTLNQEDIFNQQSNLIKKMNKDLSKDAFSMFVPSYKDLATVYQIFNSSNSPKKKILLEERLINSFANEEGNNKIVPSDSIIYKTFIKKFNNEYSTMFTEQKLLISKYVTSFVDDGIELKIYLNEEVGRLKSKIKNLIEEGQGLEQNTLKGLEGVYKTIDGFKKHNIDSKLLERVLKIQTLIRDIKNETN